MKNALRTTNQLMRKTQLRQIIRESIGEIMNEGIIDKLASQFDNLDDFTDKLKAKHPTVIEDTEKLLRKTGDVSGEILKNIGREGLNLIKEKNTTENRGEVINWVKKYKSQLLGGLATAFIYSKLNSVFSWMNGAGIWYEVLLIILSAFLVGLMIDQLKKVFSKNETEETEETEEIDFNIPLDFTPLLGSPKE